MAKLSGYDVAMEIQKRFTPEIRPYIIGYTANVSKANQEGIFIIWMHDYMDA